MEKFFGKGVVMKLGDNIGCWVLIILIGLVILDNVLGVGGYFKGWIIEIYGFESFGKIIVVFYVIVEV